MHTHFDRSETVASTEKSATAATRRSGDRRAGWRRNATLASCLSLVLGLALYAPTAVRAQAQGADGGNGTFNDPQTGSGANTAPQNSPANDPNAPDSGAAADANSGPVRMARFTVVSGDVTWRGGTEGEWSAGATNLPLRQGGQIWVPDGGKAEIQFDDGSRLRLDSNTLVTLQTLYSDSKGEYTEITLNDGQVSLRVTNQYSFYQVNTPLASVKASGPAKFRISAGNGVQIGVREGNATVQGTADHARLHNGDYIDLVDANSQYNIVDLPKADDWDAYNDARDKAIDNLATTPTAQHLPTNIDIAAGDLDSYGTWRNDPSYGWVWVPRVTDPEWRPYYQGHWVWVEPFGWTWVSSEPWGWAPYHYGTWIRASWGWSWCPGPRTQYWSPGTVAFYQNGDSVAWVPLAPREVHYPTRIAIGFGGRDWSLFFSIGGAAVYYPGEHNICEPRPWAPGYVNRVTYVNHVTNIVNVTNVTINHNTYITNQRFVAANARYGGAVTTTVAGFGGHDDHYRPVPRGDERVLFTQGRVIGAPVGPGRPVAGPQIVHPTLSSFSPNRVFTGSAPVPNRVLTQQTYRALPPAVVSSTAAAPAQPGQRFVGAPTRPGGNTGNPGTVNRPSSGLNDYLHSRSGGNPTTSTTVRPTGNSTLNPSTYTPDNPVPSRQGVGSMQRPDASTRAATPTGTTPPATGTAGTTRTANQRSFGAYTRSASDQAEDRQSTRQYGHPPVERTSSTSGSSSSSRGGGWFRSTRDSSSRDSNSKDSGNKDSGKDKGGH